jgi:purine nucleosidase
VVYALDPLAFTLRQGAVRVVTEGLAMGQTIQVPLGTQFGATDWDGHPVQSA